MTVPLTGARHQCRSCCRTVCDRCSTVPLNSVRTCRVCYLREGGGKYAEQRREKYVFLVRHAQSTWNQNVEMVKTFRNCSMEGMSMKAAVRQMGTLVSKEVWHRDHPISEEGLRQTQELRQKIAACQRRARRAGPAVDTNGLGGGSARGGPWCDWDDGGADAAERGLVGCPEVAEQERVRRFYSTFLDTRQQVELLGFVVPFEMLLLECVLLLAVARPESVIPPPAAPLAFVRLPVDRISRATPAPGGAVGRGDFLFGAPAGPG
ncbi:unnamed protein product [Prorocentrum cordatum]|uniref:Uncharacterized protein n=1 Tax=Prorocentrum cordatum TaxID=2364126 RepID=A0ABN9UWB0_9DINO|nr:unnamed protein product [Polarella glacialis]